MKLPIKRRKAFAINGDQVDLDFCLYQGCLNILSAPNGAGKTSLFTFLKLNAELLKGLGPSYIDQPPLRPLVDMKVIDALKVVEEEVPGAIDWREIPEIKELGVEALAQKNISHLSGGENQKVKFAIALMRPFEVLFADEPLQSLDLDSQKIFLSLFERLARSGKTLFIIEHDISKYQKTMNIKTLSMRKENGGICVFNNPRDAELSDGELK